MKIWTNNRSNTRWKALAEIYTMHSFAPFSNLNFFVKNRQNFFASELMSIQLFNRKHFEFCIFSANF